MLISLSSFLINLNSIIKYTFVLCLFGNELISNSLEIVKIPEFINNILSSIFSTLNDFFIKFKSSKSMWIVQFFIQKSLKLLSICYKELLFLLVYYFLYSKLLNIYMLYMLVYVLLDNEIQISYMMDFIILPVTTCPITICDTDFLLIVYLK